MHSCLICKHFMQFEKFPNKTLFQDIPSKFMTSPPSPHPLCLGLRLTGKWCSNTQWSSPHLYITLSPSTYLSVYISIFLSLHLSIPPTVNLSITASSITWHYRSGTVNSKSFVGKVLLRIKWKFELNYTL